MRRAVWKSRRAAASRTLAALDKAFHAVVQLARLVVAHAPGSLSSGAEWGMDERKARVFIINSCVPIVIHGAVDASL